VTARYTARLQRFAVGAAAHQRVGGLPDAEHFYNWAGGGDRFMGCDYIDMTF